MSVTKRVFDLFWSFGGLIVLAPVFAVVAVLIKFEDGGPVFYRQERIGYKGRPFLIWKFRTMVTDAEKCGGQLTVGRDPRITRVGYLLRKTKLDEFPQLINVFLGDMTLVGPRPEVPRYVALYTKEQRKVLNLKPGITDLASIQYINESEILAGSIEPEETYIKEVMPEKIRLNMEYTKKATVWSDIFMIINTIIYLILGRAKVSNQKSQDI